MLVASFLVAITAQAQTNSPARKKAPRYGSYFSLNLLAGVPVQEYRLATNSLPFGMNLSYVYQPSVKVPLGVGVNFNYLSVGSKTVERALTADITANGILLDQLYIPLEFQIHNNIVSLHLDGRFIAPTNVIKPYVDGLAGFNYLWTATAVYDKSSERYFDSADEEGLISRKTQIDDFTYSIGTGGGVIIQIGRKSFVNVGAHYLFSGVAQYYDRSQIKDWDIELNVTGVTQAGSGQGTFEPGDIAYSAVPKKSRTDMLKIQAGFTFNFAR